MKLAAAVILYYPTPDVVLNIQSYSSIAEKVWVLDNSEKKQRAIEEEFHKTRNCFYLQDGSNKGIAARLNQACMLAKKEGYNWLLTMDQDSRFEGENINRYLNCVEEYNGTEAAVFGVQFDSSTDQSQYCSPVKVDHLITSGSIINLNLFPVIGGFDENLFIDQVDFDYCYRSIRKGFSVIQFQNVFLKHKLGNPSQHRSLLNFRKTKRSLHAPIRIYYMTRNFLYVRSRYNADFPAAVIHSKKDLLNRIKNNLLYSPKRFLVLQYIVRGILDFKRGRLGKLPDQ